MSDGNYNKNLLPYQHYQSGLRAGKSIIQRKARISLEEVLSQRFPDLSQEERSSIITEFLDLLRT